MKLTELLSMYPQYSKQQLIQLRRTFHNIKGRCNSKSDHHKHYHDVDFNFTDLIEFINFIVSEKSKGRDYFKIKDPNICRIFDKGEYSPLNCIIRSRKQNARECTARGFKVYNSLTGKTDYQESVKLFYELNKDVLSISLSTFYRNIKNNKLIPVSNGVTSGYIKVSYI
ncbi:hypothetical protein NB573_05045 [Vibrio alginolyticus]|uniref:hypothetical protein n=1 Tax=Vibrio alginolyticus TaxID=663 RepID=UPI00215C087C|nr:hypothetical protein [Vibrio alginolyticus]MCR9959429.1 hypothetical protein [Vibrio alginolyticus]